MMLWIFAALCAFFVKGLCGFANSLVFTTIVAFGESNVNISPVEIVLGFPTNVIITWKERRNIPWKVCLLPILLTLAGSIPGMLLLKGVDTSIIKVVFGIVTILLGLEMLVQQFHPTKFQEQKWFTLLIGILSGMLCGLFGVGALMGAYISRVTKDSHAFKGSMAFIFFVENIVRMIVYSLLGVITLSTLRTSVMLMPVMLLGLFLGMLCSRKLNETLVKRVVIVMLVLSGVALVVMR